MGEGSFATKLAIVPVSKVVKPTRIGFTNVTRVITGSLIEEAMPC